MNQKIQNLIKTVPAGVVAVLSFAICAGLGVASLFVLANMQAQDFATEISEKLTVGHRNILSALLGPLLLTGVLLAAVRLTKRYINWKTARWVSLAAGLGTAALCFWWMASFSAAPSADQDITWSFARELALRTGMEDWQYDYLRIHPYQAGTAMIMEGCIRLFGDSWYPWLALCALSAGGIVVLLSCLCARITDSACAKCLCAVLLLSFFPLAMYSTFVYGTLPGILLALFGLYAILRECSSSRHQIGWWAAAVLAFTIAVILYTGEQIFLAAGVIVLFVAGLQRPGQRRKMLAAVLLAVLAVGMCKGWQALAMSRFGMPNDPGCPILPRILMGVDAHSENPAPGFYNGICLSVFRECNYDAALANQVSIGHIRNSLVALHEQGRFVKFFAEKTLDQWLEPWFSALSMSNPSIYNEPKWLATALTTGGLFAPLQAWLSVLLSFIYLGGAAGVVVTAKRKKGEVLPLLLMVCLIGGFLFQLAYETKARYCMPYYLCCFPMAAAGLAALAEKLAKKQNEEK